jgi:hypothetical protein
MQFKHPPSHFSVTIKNMKRVSQFIKGETHYQEYNRTAFERHSGLNRYLSVVC